MKHAALMLLNGAALVIALTATAPAQRLFPTNPRTDETRAAAGLTLTLADGTACAVALTGDLVILQGATVVSGTTNTVAIEIKSLDLVGALPDGSPVRLRAGVDLTGLAATGEVVSTNGFFPATSTLELPAELELPGGTTTVTAAPLQLAAVVNTLSPIGDAFASAGAVALLDAATEDGVGELVQFWFQTAARGKQTLVGMSLDVTATNTAGQVELQACPEGSVVAALARVRGSELAGVVAPNLGCDEILGTNLLFAAKFNKTLRVADWRGFHSGNWILYTLTETGGTNLVAFGKLNGTDGVRPQRLPVFGTADADCAACGHFEGKLSGRLIDKSVVRGGKIEASYAGRFLDDEGVPVGCCPPPATPPHGPVSLTIDGVIITRCLPALESSAAK